YRGGYRGDRTSQKHRQNNNGTTVWYCCKHIRLHCHARLVTDGNRIVRESQSEHSHEGNGEKAMARKAVGEMKVKMLDIGATPSSVQGAVSVELEDRILMALPKRATVNRSLQCYRKKVTD